MSKSIYKLKLNESKILVDNAHICIEVFRVPGGWLYVTRDKRLRNVASTFVNFNSEFAELDNG